MPTPPRPAHRDLRLVGLVALGGAIGSVLRYAVALALPVHDGGWPLATLTVNVVGAFALGWLLEGLAGRGRETLRVRRLRLFAGTGLLGGFTTYSSLALETERLLAAGDVALALAYLSVTLVVGSLAAAAGVAVGLRTPAGVVRLLLREQAR